MDIKTQPLDEFTDLPITIEIAYRDALSSYKALLDEAEGRIDRLDVDMRVKYLATLAIALEDIDTEIKSLHLVRRINNFKEEDYKNLQIVSRMGVDDEGKPKYIVEHSPVDIPIEDRNMNDALFKRDKRHLMRLKSRFEEVLRYYKVTEK